MAIRIFIDPGHNPGTINAGAEVNGILEADINFMVGNYLAEILRMDNRFAVRMSRNTITDVIGTDRDDSLNKRIQMANDWPADYFISIHCNYNDDSNIHGSEVYIYRANSQGQWLAESLLSNLVDVVQMDNNGIYVDPELIVLQRTTMPANLVELGYLSNDGDFQKLVTEQLLFAIALYVGLLEYFDFLD